MEEELRNSPSIIQSDFSALGGYTGLEELLRRKTAEMMLKKSGISTQTKGKPIVEQTAAQFKGMPFKEWLKSFEASLIVGQNAWKGLQSWIQSEEGIASKFEVPWREDCRKHVLERMHSTTSPRPELEETPLEQNEQTKKDIREVLSKLESLTKRIRGRGVTFSTGLVNIDLSKLLGSLDRAANDSRKTLEAVDHPYPRHPKIIEQYMPLMTYIDWLPEDQAHALALLAMKAHGYQDVDLVALCPNNRNSGTVRKHLKSNVERFMTVIAHDVERTKE